MAEREAIYKLKFQVDKSGQQESIRAIDALASEFEDLDKNAQQVSRSAQLAVSKLGAFGQGRAELQATATEAKDAAVATEDFASALDSAAQASKNMERIKDEVREARKEIEQASQATLGLENRLDAADENFDVVSRRVGLAGDVQSNLGATRGLADAAGLGKTGQVIGIAGEFAALTEELPRLKAAVSNMPDVLKFVTSQIGATGVGLIGALAVLGIAISELSKQASDNRGNVREFIDAQREYNTFLGTATKESIDERIAELNRQLEAEKTTLATARQVRDELNARTNEAFGESSANVLRGIDDVTGAFGTFDETVKQVEKSKDIIGTTEKEIQKLSLAYNDQGVIARSLAEEEKRLAEERLKNDLAYISFLEERNRRMVAAEELLATGTEEQVQARIDAIKQEQEVNRRNLADLENITGSSIADLLADAELDPAIKESIEGYQQAISDSQEELDLLTGKTFSLSKAHSALNSALANQEDVIKERVNQIKEQAQAELEFSRFLKTATAENVASRIEALQEEAAALRSMLPELQKLAPTSEAAADELQATTDRLGEIDAQLKRMNSEGVIAAIQREQEELTEEIIRIEAARDERIAQLREQAAQKEAQLYEDLQRSLADAIADANEERAEAQREYQEEAAQIEQDLARKRLEIEKKYSRDAANAIGDRDALALYQAKQSRNEQLEDAEDAAAQARQDLQRNYAQQLDTINRELAKQQQALQAKYQQQLNDLRTATANSINLERQKAAQEIAARQQAYQQELAQLNSFAQQGVMSISTFSTNSLSTLGGFVTQAQAIMAGLINSTATSPTAPVPNPIPTTTPPPPGRMGGPQPYPGINVTVSGYTIPVIQQQILDALKLVLPF